MSCHAHRWPTPRPVPQFVEKHCLSGGAGEVSGGKFAVNAAVVREYLTALVKTGRLSEFGDAADAAPEQGQNHRSLAQLLAELQSVAGGGAPAAAPGATLARPLHVIVQAQVGAVSWSEGPWEAQRAQRFSRRPWCLAALLNDHARLASPALDLLGARTSSAVAIPGLSGQPRTFKEVCDPLLQEKGGGFWGAVSSFLWTCLGMFAFFYIMSAGQATFRRFQGSSAGAGVAGALPGGAAGVAASSREGGGMFAAKEYSKVSGVQGARVAHRFACVSPAYGPAVVSRCNRAFLVLRLAHTLSACLPARVAGEPAGEEREDVCGRQGLRRGHCGAAGKRLVRTPVQPWHFCHCLDRLQGLACT